MKKLISLALCCMILISNFSIANAASKAKNLKEKEYNTQLLLKGEVQARAQEELEQDGLDNSELELELTGFQDIDGTKYAIVLNDDVEELRAMALNSVSILQRIRDLERLYKQIVSIINGIKTAIDFIEDFFNIDIPLDGTGDNDSGNSTSGQADSFEHISGVVMTPGSVEFQISTREGQTFDELGMDQLEIDLFYNKKLFDVNQIVGDTISGEFTKLKLSSKDRNAKDRIIIPLSDLFTNKAKINIFLEPRDPDTIKVGHKTKMQIRYFRRVPKGEEAPLIYELAPGSTDTIEVTVK